MLNLSPATRVFVATAPVDLRGSFNALQAVVQTQLQADPLSGHLFVFANARRNRVKILFWDGSGRVVFCLLANSAWANVVWWVMPTRRARPPPRSKEVHPD